MKYRLYVDEVGNSGLGANLQHPNERYLSLTGVVIELDYVDTKVAPQLEALKRRFFRTHVDEPVILHRKELVNRQYPFQSLRDSAVEKAFNADLLGLLKSLDYTTITVVIDKYEHLQRYKVWRYDPYHYCQEVLLERYVLWLEHQSATGDVMAESRGGREDRRLKESFQRIWRDGTPYVSAAQLASRLSSKQLKVKTKANNIAGLQLADLLAHPSFKYVLCRRQKVAQPQTFGAKIAQILVNQKYLRNEGGTLDGWGCKWLP
jgi:hypothetical protein